jgi:hypothetical protein
MDTPTPGLRGTYEDSCVVCLRGTDSGVAFTGTAEWIVAGLVKLGVPEEEAVATLSRATGCDPGMVPGGEFAFPIRVCEECADRTGLVVGLIASGQLPNYYSKTSHEGPGGRHGTRDG